MGGAPRNAAAASSARRMLGLALLALTLTLVYGIWYAYGVIMVALLREFGWSRSVLAGAFSVFTLVHGLANPIVGWLCTRVHPPRLVAGGGVLLAAALWLDSLISAPWHLYVGFGVLTAAAVAVSGWVPALVQAQSRFPDRLGLALGIVSSGVGLGMLLIVPLVQVLIESLGWRAAFRVLAAGCALWVVPAALYLARTSPQALAAPVRTRAATASAGERAADTRSMNLSQALRTLPFWLIVAAFFFGNVCSQTLHVHQVVYLVDHGVSAIVAASVVGVVGASSIVAKIGSGWMSDSVGRERVFIVCIAILVAAVGALVLVGAYPSRFGAYAYAILLGVGYSVTATMTPAMASDRFGGPHFGAIVGIGLLGSALGSALGPWLAGWLFDLTGSYAAPFAIAAGCGVVAGWAGWQLKRVSPVQR